MDFNILKLHIPPPDKTTNLDMTQVSFDPLHPLRKDRQSKTVHADSHNKDQLRSCDLAAILVSRVNVLTASSMTFSVLSFSIFLHSQP